MGETNKRCEIKITAVAKISIMKSEINRCSLAFDIQKKIFQIKDSSNMEGGGGDGAGGIGSHHRGGGGGLIKQQRHSTGRFLLLSQLFNCPLSDHQNMFDT